MKILNINTAKTITYKSNYRNLVNNNCIHLSHRVELFKLPNPNSILPQINLNTFHNHYLWYTCFILLFYLILVIQHLKQDELVICS